MMSEKEFIDSSVDKVVADTSLSWNEKVSWLQEQLQDERAKQRAASESDMIVDQGQGARLSEIEQALESLGADATTCEDTKAATL